MASLPKSIKSDLINSYSDNKRYECYQMKLTDSAWSALKTFYKDHASNASFSLTVKQTEGVINLSPENSKPLSSPQFTFRIIPFSTDAAVRLECMKFPSKCRKAVVRRVHLDEPLQLTSLGTIHKKLHVNANDDVYSATKKKISLVEQEKERHSTVTIRGPAAAQSASLKRIQARQQKEEAASKTPKGASNAGPSLRERVIHALALGSHKGSDLLQRLNANSSSNPVELRLIQPLLDQVARLDKRDKYHLLHEMFNEVSEKWPLYSVDQMARVKDRKAIALQHVRGTSNTTNSHKSTNEVSSSVETSTTSNNNDIVAGVRTSGTISRAPLAPQSYTRKVEALDLLADGQSVTTVALKMRLTESILAKWKEDEANIRKQALQRGIVGRHNLVSSDATSNKTVSAPPPEAAPVTSSKPANESHAPGPSSNVSSKTAASFKSSKRPAGVEVDALSLKNAVAKPSSPKQRRVSSAIEENERVSSSDNPRPEADSETEEIAALEREFPPIQSSVEFTRYCATFNADYPEYRELCEELMEKDARRQDLHERLEACTDAEEREGSEAFRAIARQVQKFYEEVVRQDVYKAKVKRVVYLHHRLALIKSHILNYKQRRKRANLQRQQSHALEPAVTS